VRHWLGKPAAGQVVVFDALTYAGNIDNLAGLDRNPRYLFVKGDICDEPAVRALLERHQIDTVVHFAAESHQFPEKLIPLAMVNILLGKPLAVYGDGLQVRDWLHVEDHCVAIALALTRGRSGEVYNVGGQQRDHEHRDRALAVRFGGRAAR